MQLIKKNKEIIVLAILAVVFFFIYSYLPISQLSWQNKNQVENFALKFNTPDEVVNYYFATQYAETNQLYYDEPLNAFMNRVIFPRWALVITHTITPGNFLGIDLIYGSIAKIFSTSVIPFLTPLFAVLGVLFFYLLLKMIFDKKVAFVSALLIFVFPGFWYYASRTMFHNVLFLALLIIGLYFLIKFLNASSRDFKREFMRTKKYVYSILSGLFFGLALITRTSEITWIFLMVLMILMFNLRKLKQVWPYLLISAFVIALTFILVLYHNKILYNNYLATGYPLNTVSTNLESGETSSVNFIQALVLPFGFHPRVIVTHVFYNYILKLFWPWLLLWSVGLVAFLCTKKIKDQKMYFVISLVVTCYLLIYYGSWFFRDALDPNLISLGSSYVRYFLPIFVFGIPLIAFLLIKIGEFLNKKNKILFTGYWLLVTGYFLIFGGYVTLYDGPESLTSVKNQLIKYQIQAQDILEYTYKDDIILMDVSSDKIIFPLRKHIIVQQGGVEWPEIQKILPYRNVWYFYNNQKVSQDYLNENKFNLHGLELKNEVLISGGGKFYKITKIQDTIIKK